MDITFRIKYNTAYGQSLSVSCIFLSQGKNTRILLPMEYLSDGVWERHLQCEAPVELSYGYQVNNADGTVMRESMLGRRLKISEKTAVLVACDSWQGFTPQSPFTTAPFASIFYPHKESSEVETHIYDREVLISVTIPLVEEGGGVFLCGSSSSIGGWNPEKAVRMTPASGCCWNLMLDASLLESRCEFKFLRSNADGEMLWEEGENHILAIENLQDGGTLKFEYSAAGFPLDLPRFAGSAIPVFSLRSVNDWGIGDFDDIKLYVDWAASTGQKIVQTLPVNDTTSTKSWTDSYPYSAISAMALNPVYLSPSAAGTLENKAEAAEFENERLALNALQKIDYEKVRDLKERFSRALYAQQGEQVMGADSYRQFFESNISWLRPYAAFCILRDMSGTADFSTWGEFALYDAAKIEAFVESQGVKEEAGFYYFVQYLLHSQLSEAHRYATSKGVALKGDIPIGITPHSVEAWCEPRYFNMDSQTGAPPDAFAVNGQNWGFPTYRWDAIEADGYRWWKRRLAKMAEYFDAYRIDHVLGFFRIWEIPSEEVYGLMGHFNPALPYSEEELRSQGFDFNLERDARPYIRRTNLEAIFGNAWEFVSNNFMNVDLGEIYSLKEQFSTQRKIARWFASEENLAVLEAEASVEEAEVLREGLMGLVSDRLFVEDPHHAGYYHPRIAAQGTNSYCEMEQWRKDVYDRIYNDFFYRRNDELWKEKAYRKLSEVITATNMLPCAEDLGMIPGCVPEVLSNLRILTLEVQRMPKEMNVPLGHPENYPYMSVCTTGSHDTSTLRGWWEEDAELTQFYYNEYLNFSGEAPARLQPWITEVIIRQHLDSPAMFAIFPLQDLMATTAATTYGDASSERINVPANPHHYWRWRMPVTIENLAGRKPFNEHVKNIIKIS